MCVFDRMISVPTEKGKTMPDCKNCIEKCPQAEMAHEIAKGRMYATNEFVKLVKKIESGQLVEVVRCKDCAYGDMCSIREAMACTDDNGFCWRGKRRTDG